MESNLECNPDNNIESNLNTIPGFGLSANTLKLIAIIAMLIDHIGWAFVPTTSLLGQVMHAIGRLTAPIMCYFIAEGYYHTRDVKKYAIRLGMFALISHAPFIFFESGKLPIYFENGLQIKMQTSVMYTLFLGLLALIVWNDTKLKEHVKVLIIAFICLLALPGDWVFFTVLWILVFGVYHGDLRKQIIGFSIIALLLAIMSMYTGITGNSVWWRQVFQLGVYLAIPLLMRFNGKLGYNKNNKWVKWSFYIFYPLHMLIIGLIKYVILPS